MLFAPIRKYPDLNMRVGFGGDVAGGHADAIFRAITDAIQVSKMYWHPVDQSTKYADGEQIALS